MKPVLVLALVLALQFSSSVEAQCTGSNAGCNLVCGVTFGFGNPGYCALFDDNGKVYSKLSFLPPCPKAGCFPIAQTLVKNTDGTVSSIILHGNSTDPAALSLTQSKLSVSSQLAFLGNQNLTRPKAMKIIGAPFLQAIQDPATGKTKLAYLHRGKAPQSGSSAVDELSPASLFAELGLANFDGNKLKPEKLKQVFGVDEDEYEILGIGASQPFPVLPDGICVTVTIVVRSKKTGAIKSISSTNCDFFFGGSEWEKPVETPIQGPEGQPGVFATALDLSPVDEVLAAGSSAAGKSFVVERIVRRTSPSSFSSQLVLRTMDSNLKLSAPKVIAPEAKTLQPAAERLQSVAVDPNERFVLYTATSSSCGVGSIRYQKLNPASGKKMGAAKPIVSCADLTTTITGLYGIDVLDLR